jgi:hypothetical protein
MRICGQKVYSHYWNTYLSNKYSIKIESLLFLHTDMFFKKKTCKIAMNNRIGELIKSDAKIKFNFGIEWIENFSFRP